MRLTWSAAVRVGESKKNIFKAKKISVRILGIQFVKVLTFRRVVVMLKYETKRS